MERWPWLVQGGGSGDGKRETGPECILHLGQLEEKNQSLYYLLCTDKQPDPNKIIIILKYKYVFLVGMCHHCGDCGESSGHVSGDHVRIVRLGDHKDGDPPAS